MNLNAAEDDAVLHGPGDHAAIRHKRVADVRALQITGWRLVLDLGLDRIVPEQAQVLLPLQQLQTVLVIAGQRIDDGVIAGILIGRDLEIAASLLDGIPEEVAFAVGDAVFHLLQKELLLHNEQIQIDIGMGLLLVDVRHEAVFPDLKPQAGIMLGLKLVDLLVDERDVSAFLNMIIKHFLEVGRIDMLASGMHDIFGGCPFEEIQVVMIMLKIPKRRIGRIVPVRRQNEQPAMLAVHIPGLPVSQMVHQRTVFTANEYANAFKLGVHHIGQDEIDQTVTTCKRHGRPAPEIGQFVQMVQFMIQIDYSHELFH
ncbi:hypothetical protein D3C71_1168060 [compost metagenome]